MSYTPTATLTFGGAYTPTATLTFGVVYIPTISSSATFVPTATPSVSATVRYGPKLTSSTTASFTTPSVNATVAYTVPVRILTASATASLPTPTVASGITYVQNLTLTAATTASISPSISAVVKYGQTIVTNVEATVLAPSGDVSLVATPPPQLTTNITLPPSNLWFWQPLTHSGTLLFTQSPLFPVTANASLTYTPAAAIVNSNAIADLATPTATAFLSTGSLSSLVCNVTLSPLAINITAATNIPLTPIVYSSNVWRGLYSHTTAITRSGNFITSQVSTTSNRSSPVDKMQIALCIDGYKLQSNLQISTANSTPEHRHLRCLTSDGKRVDNNTNIATCKGLPTTIRLRQASVTDRQPQRLIRDITPFALSPPKHLRAGYAGEILQFRTSNISSLVKSAAKLLEVIHTHGNPLTPGVTVVVPTPLPLPPVPITHTTVYIPVQRTYIVANSFSLVRTSDNAIIYATSFNLSIDSGSWSFNWSAKVHGKQITSVVSSDILNPVEVTATVNGTVFNLVVEKVTRDRTFGSDLMTISGRGISCYLALPYAPITSVFSTAAITANQAANLSLEYNNVSIGWAINWQIADWLIAGSAFSSTGAWIDHLQVIAEAGGGYLQPDPANKTMWFMPYYPTAPWDWATTTPDVVMTEDSITVEGIEYVSKTPYDSVWIAGGANGGRLDLVTITGSGAMLPAPTVVDNLATDPIMTRQRGLRVVGDTGIQCNVSLTLPIFPTVGIILPGKLVQYKINGISHLGMVRGCSVTYDMPKVRQTITLETHEYI